MTKYYVGEYGFSLQTAAFWQRVLVCLVGYCVHWVGGCQISIRHTQSLGGYFGHRFLLLFALSYPQTFLTIQTVEGKKAFILA